MTIEIDDAGTGDLIGDAFIGFIRVETKQIIFRTIPLELFKEENWKNKMPFKAVVDLVKDGLKELNFDIKREKVLICRGNIFDYVRIYFDEVGINHEPSIVEGILQDAVEGKLVQHLRSLGVTSINLTKKSGAQRFFVLFDWVCQDFYNREKYVKNGFKKWKAVWYYKGIEKYNKICNQKNKYKENIYNKEKK